MSSNDNVLDCGFLALRGRGDLGVELPGKKHAVLHCSQTVSPMLPAGEYKQGAIPFLWKITLVFDSLFLSLKLRRLAYVSA